MRAVVQRVSEGLVRIDGALHGRIEDGLLVYLGVGRGDGDTDVRYLAEKVRHLRVFQDDGGHMNLDVKQVGGSVLVISAFTVQADARRGRRPSFEDAEQPDRAAVLYEMFCDELLGLGVRVEKGVFGAMMDVVSTNAGPVCVLLESRRAF
ncbi:MAG: D-tyrosyl-tRNA(Tyr) deacylase [Planctomycetes bacterium]|nr:D-tyrosyl-tRNA(Tyr) deacylase [Planctomycetota bacterium]